MKPTRFRFTIGQVIALIIESAVLFAALRTPFWPAVLAIQVVLAGFAVDRAKGGNGIYGAMIAGAIGLPVSLLAIVGSLHFVDLKRVDIPGFLFILLGGAVVGGSCGMVVGYWAWLHITPFSKAEGASQRADDPIGSIVQPSEAGGRRP
jgi:hypothetical protein